jgi:hypothetical protein
LNCSWLGLLGSIAEQLLLLKQRSQVACGIDVNRKHLAPHIPLVGAPEIMQHRIWTMDGGMYGKFDGECGWRVFADNRFGETDVRGRAAF